MPVDSTHPLYDEMLPKWVRARDVLAGEDAVKAGGETYMPRLDSQSDEEYAKYLSRGSFFGASARTSEGFRGMVFRRDPVVKLPDPATPLGAVMERFRTDVDLLGTSLFLYCKNVAGQILDVGRSGTLVEWNESEQRPFVCNYQAEQILNWRMSRIYGKQVLSLVTLLESVELPSPDDPFELVCVPQVRVLRLVDSAVPSYFVVDVWQQQPLAKTPDSAKEWVLVETRVPMRRGVALPFIPFVFHGPQNDLPTPARPPLDDIIIVNLDHFRLDVDFKHGLHFTALPTAWVSGFDRSTTLKIGSSTAWVSDVIGASAGYLEFKGQGLQTHEREKDRDEKLMAILGSRMLESQKRVSESAEALQLRQAGESSIVANISGSISKGLTKVLRWAYWWQSTEDDPERIPLETVSIDLNKDFETATMTAQELVAVVQAWQAGLLSRDSAHDLMRQGELIAQNRTNAEEADLIEAAPPPVLGRPADMKAVESAVAGSGGGSLPAK
jgi:hypothetical protein